MREASRPEAAKATRPVSRCALNTSTKRRPRPRHDRARPLRPTPAWAGMAGTPGPPRRPAPAQRPRRCRRGRPWDLAAVGPSGRAGRGGAGRAWISIRGGSWRPAFSAAARLRGFQDLSVALLHGLRVEPGRGVLTAQDGGTRTAVYPRRPSHPLRGDLRAESVSRGTKSIPQVPRRPLSPVSSKLRPAIWDFLL